MKIVFMGTPEFAVAALKRIIEEGHDVAAVVTQPDKPKGRGNKIQSPPVKDVAMDNNIPVLQPKKVRDAKFIEELKNLNPECIIVAAYGQILPEEILNMPKYGCINIHASLLPKYRGAAPIHWSVVNGEEKTGITIMQMDEGLDTGDMLLKVEVGIGQKTTGELHNLLAEKGGELIVGALEKLQDGTIKRTKQNNDKSSYAPMLDKKIGQIDWNKDAAQIERLIRGLNPWPIAYTIYEGNVLKIWEAKVLDKKSQLPNGTIISVTKTGIEIAAGGKVLLATRIQFPNKRAVTVDEYLRGNEIKEGILLGVEG